MHKRCPGGGFAIRRLFFAFFLAAGFLCLASFSKCSVFPEEGEPESVTILSYNACNLFDDTDNGSEYPEFDPSSGEWNSGLYHSRLEKTAEIIISSFPPDAPDIICLQEIENRNVLEDLVSTALKGFSYNCIICPEDGESAVTTGIISRFPASESRYHAVHVSGFSLLRPLTEAVFETGGNSLYVFNCHFKSKLGGSEYTEKARVAAASALSQRCGEIFSDNPDASVIIAGDLNENIDEYSRTGEKYATALMPADLAPAAPSKGCIAVTGLKGGAAGKETYFSPWFDSPGKGSYSYKGIWETIDHFLLPQSMFDGKEFDYQGFTVIDNEKFCTYDGRPLKWISSTGTGYSDHFPVLLEITRK